MLRASALVALILAGCNSENRLGQKPGVGIGTMADTGGLPGPDPSTTDTDGGLGPNEDTYPTGEEPPWIWETDDPTGDTDPGTPTGPGTPSEPGTPTGPTPPGDTGVITTITPNDTGFTDDQICEAAAALAGFLDPWQTAGDNRVYYCHNSSGSNWTFVESDISSCLPHLNHAFDVFPTTGCDS